MMNICKLNNMFLPNIVAHKIADNDVIMLIISILYIRLNNILKSFKIKI